MSKVYIYESLDRVSTYYHDGGGAVIITDGEPQDAWYDHFKSASDKAKYDKAQLLEIAQVQLPEADIVLNTDDVDKQVIIFKDAGCC